MDGLGGLPPQDLLANGDAAAAAVPPPVPVTDHGKDRKRRRKHEDAAAGDGAGVVAAATARSSEIDDVVAAADGAQHRRRRDRHHRLPRAPASERTGTGDAGYTNYDYDDAPAPRERGGFSAAAHYSDAPPEIDGVAAAAAADGAATDGAHRRRHHRRPRAPAPEWTGTGGASSNRYDDYDGALGPRDQGSLSAVVHYSKSAPATPGTKAILINGRHGHRAAAAGYSSGGGASSYYDSDGGGGHVAAASPSSSSRRHAVRDERPAASARRHSRPPAKPHGAHGYSAAADAVPGRGSSAGVRRYESPTPPAARPNGIVIGGSKHKHHQATAGDGAAYYYGADDDYAAAGASRLTREPAAPPRHHLDKPPMAHGAPSSSASASAAAREEHDAAAYEELCYRVGLEVAGKMDEATLLSLAKKHAAGVMGQGHGQQQPAAEAVKEEKVFSFWLSEEEADADLRKVDEYYYLEVEQRNQGAAGNGKRRRH